jgi:hypothetical protein
MALVTERCRKHVRHFNITNLDEFFDENNTAVIRKFMGKISCSPSHKHGDG